MCVCLWSAVDISMRDNEIVRDNGVVSQTCVDEMISTLIDESFNT